MTLGVMSCLKELHEANIIHGNLKPRSIFHTSNGVYKFGLFLFFIFFFVKEILFYFISL
jgi:hypothetical protein